MSFRLSNKMPNESRNIDDKIEAKQKYFFVLEGEKTEDIYIRELSNHLRDDALADVVLLERVESAESNQFKITKAISNYLDKSLSISEDQKQEILKLCNSFDEYQINEEELITKSQEILGELAESFITDYNNNVIEQVKLLNELRNYEKGFDKICLILDRDYRSFKPDQFDQVIKICKENGFLLGLSNPNFEFYLLLHITNAKDIDAEKIANNKRMSKSKSSRKYTEHLLNEEMKKFNLSYLKKKYDASFFIKRFNDALENSSYYQQNNILLKDEIGTSVPNIIKDLI